MTAGIDKMAFLKRVAGKSTATPSDASENTPPPETDGAMTCGEQLVKALGISGADTEAVDQALREAVQKYGGDSEDSGY